MQMYYNLRCSLKTEIMFMFATCADGAGTDGVFGKKKAKEIHGKQTEMNPPPRLVLLRGELQVCAVLVVGNLRHRDLAPEVGREERVRFRDLDARA